MVSKSSSTALEAYFDELRSAVPMEMPEEIEHAKTLQTSCKSIEDLCDEFGLDEKMTNKALNGESLDTFRKRLNKEDLTKSERNHFMEKLTRLKTKLVEAYESLLVANLRLVVHIAKRYKSASRIEFEDLINEGNIGLMKALERFDPDRGYRLGTYAVWWIRRYILRALAEHGRLIRLPTKLSQLLHRWKMKARELRQKLHREPRSEEVAEALNIDEKTTRRLVNRGRVSSSLDVPIGEQGQLALEDVLEEDDSLEVDREFEEPFLMELLAETLKEVLNNRERYVLMHRHGINNGGEQTLEEVAEKLDLSREWVRQIQEKAYEKIRNSGKGEELYKFFKDRQ